MENTGNDSIRVVGGSGWLIGCSSFLRRRRRSQKRRVRGGNQINGCFITFSFLAASNFIFFQFTDTTDEIIDCLCSRWIARLGPLVPRLLFEWHEGGNCFFVVIKGMMTTFDRLSRWDYVSITIQLHRKISNDVVRCDLQKFSLCKGMTFRIHGTLILVGHEISENCVVSFGNWGRHLLLLGFIGGRGCCWISLLERCGCWISSLLLGDNYGHLERYRWQMEILFVEGRSELTIDFWCGAII
mmetsp:Transcript_20654/g.32324  ORF Transcript_20654/g.32324 Transcript_20654/m.32324 type:complete len:242 (+) Transcript_20654:86-811(+)